MAGDKKPISHDYEDAVSYLTKLKEKLRPGTGGLTKEDRDQAMADAKVIELHYTKEIVDLYDRSGKKILQKKDPTYTELLTKMVTQQTEMISDLLIKNKDFYDNMEMENQNYLKKPSPESDKPDDLVSLKNLLGSIEKRTKNPPDFDPQPSVDIKPGAPSGDEVPFKDGGGEKKDVEPLPKPYNPSIALHDGLEHIETLGGLVPPTLSIANPGSKGEKTIIT